MYGALLLSIDCLTCVFIRRNPIRHVVLLIFLLYWFSAAATCAAFCVLLSCLLSILLLVRCAYVCILCVSKRRRRWRNKLKYYCAIALCVCACVFFFVVNRPRNIDFSAGDSFVSCTRVFRSRASETMMLAPQTCFHYHPNARWKCSFWIRLIVQKNCHVRLRW